MGGATPHGGVEPSVGPKTVVVGFPRVVVEGLLALAELARGQAATVEGMNVYKVDYINITDYTDTPYTGTPVYTRTVYPVIPVY